MAYINGRQILQMVSTVGGGGTEGGITPLVNLGYTSEMKLQYDGEYNAGTTHDATATSWIDISGYGHDMELYNPVWGTESLTGNGTCTGKFPLELPNIIGNGAIPEQTGYTIEICVRPALNGARHCIYGGFYSGSPGLCGLFNVETTTAGKFRLYYMGASYTSPYIDVSFGTVTSGELYDIVITSDGTNINVYVNNVLEHTHVCPTIPATNISHYYYMCRDTRESYQFIGDVHSFIAYEKVLTSEEIESHYTLNYSRFGNLTNVSTMSYSDSPTITEPEETTEIEQSDGGIEETQG